MAMSRVKDFRFIQPEWSVLRFSPTGMVGRDIDRRATYVANMARAQVGMETGNLRRSISKTPVYTSPTGPFVSVVSGGPSAPYALMHHEGTRPHPITPRPPRTMLKFKVGSRAVYATRVLHPGTRANKYLTDHLEAAVNI